MSTYECWSSGELRGSASSARSERFRGSTCSTCSTCSPARSTASHPSPRIRPGADRRISISPQGPNDLGAERAMQNVSAEDRSARSGRKRRTARMRNCGPEGSRVGGRAPRPRAYRSASLLTGQAGPFAGGTSRPCSHRETVLQLSPGHEQEVGQVYAELQSSRRSERSDGSGRWIQQRRGWQAYTRTSIRVEGPGERTHRPFKGEYISRWGGGLQKPVQLSR